MDAAGLRKGCLRSLRRTVRIGGRERRAAVRPGHEPDRRSRVARVGFRQPGAPNCHLRILLLALERRRGLYSRTMLREYAEKLIERGRPGDRVNARPAITRCEDRTCSALLAVRRSHPVPNRLGARLELPRQLLRRPAASRRLDQPPPILPPNTGGSSSSSRLSSSQEVGSPWTKQDGIQSAMTSRLTASLCVAKRSEYARDASRFAPCQPGASPVSVLALLCPRAARCRRKRRNSSPAPSPDTPFAPRRSARIPTPRSGRIPHLPESRSAARRTDAPPNAGTPSPIPTTSSSARSVPVAYPKTDSTLTS